MLKELLASFLITLLFLNFTLMMEKLLRLSRLLSGVGVSVVEIGEIILYLQPQLLILTIPMSLLLSVLLAYGRMNTDSELIILRSSGMSFRGISMPVVYLGLGCLLTSLLMSFYMGPKGSSILRKTVSDIMISKAPMTIEEGIFNTAFKNIVILVREKPSPERLSGIFIVDERVKGEQKIITAGEGKIMPENDSLGFSLSKGHIYITKGNIFTEIKFGNYFFKLNPAIDSPVIKNSELTPLGLWNASRESNEKKISYLLEFHRRLSMPAICLILILLGPSLSLMAGKAGRLGGLTIGLSVFAVYYTFLLYGEKLARSGKLPHFIGAWMSFVILGAFSVWVFERVNKK